MRQLFYITIILLFLFVNLLYSIPPGKKWEGTLDQKGRLQLHYKLSLEHPFFLQGFIWLDGYWRPFSLYWDKKIIWADLGQDFAGTKYRIHLLNSKE